MDDKTPEPQEALPKKEQKPINKNIFYSVIGILLIALGASGYLYAQQSKEVEKLSSQLTVATADEVAPADGTESPEAVAEEVPDVASCQGGSSYTAEVGQFTLDLPEEYVIIRTLDAGFEGGPSTVLQIGNCVSGEENVVDNGYVAQTPSLNAYPSDATIDELIASSKMSSYPDQTELDAIDIAGEEARVFSVSGLFNENYIFWIHDGVGFTLSSINTGEDSSVIPVPMQAVIDNISYE